MTSELDRLERQAQQARGQLAQDLDELMVRLTPRQMAQEAAAYAREMPADVGRHLVREIRRDPVPYLLIGFGIAGMAWAIASASRDRARRRLPEFRESDFAPAAPADTPSDAVATPRPVAPALRPEATHPERIRSERALGPVTSAND